MHACACECVCERVQVRVHWGLQTLQVMGPWKTDIPQVLGLSHQAGLTLTGLPLTGVSISETSPSPGMRYTPALLYTAVPLVPRTAPQIRLPGLWFG